MHVVHVSPCTHRLRFSRLPLSSDVPVHRGQTCITATIKLRTAVSWSPTFIIVSSVVSITVITPTPFWYLRLFVIAWASVPTDTVVSMVSEKRLADFSAWLRARVLFIVTILLVASSMPSSSRDNDSSDSMMSSSDTCIERCSESTVVSATVLPTFGAIYANQKDEDQSHFGSAYHLTIYHLTSE